MSDSANMRDMTLDLTDDEMRELASRTVALVTDYFAHISRLPVFPATTAQEVAAALSADFPQQGTPLEQLMEDCRRIFDLSRHNGHPRFFGYVASPATPVGTYATLLTAALNQNVTSWRSAPAATEIEKTVVRWLASMIGFRQPDEEHAGGLLTSGGSLANLNALYIAHRTKLPGDDASRQGLWNTSAPATIYVSDQVHLSLPKAADLLGLGREQVRVIETDTAFRMDVRALREKIRSDLKQGARPFCVVASAGTVSTGAVDPLAEMASVAEEHGLWFHIDGAYGALAALDPAKRVLMAGLERADSVSLDPHKWLYAPLDCGCLLLREARHAHAAFSGTGGDYIKVFEHHADEAFAFWDYGIELSRPFRALKVWMMLRYYGVPRIAAAIQADNARAVYLSEQIEAAEDFELLAPVSLGICCFRYVPTQIRDTLATTHDAEERERALTQLNELNARLMHTMQRGGRAYLSNAILRGRFALRMSITNFRTTRRDLDATLEIIRDAARGLSAPTEAS